MFLLSDTVCHQQYYRAAIIWGCTLESGGSVIWIRAVEQKMMYLSPTVLLLATNVRYAGVSFAVMCLQCYIGSFVPFLYAYILVDTVMHHTRQASSSNDWMVAYENGFNILLRELEKIFDLVQIQAPYQYVMLGSHLPHFCL